MRKNRMVVIDPDVENLKVSSRGAIIKKWNRWVKKDKIIEIPKRIEDANWQELKKLLN